MDFKPSQIAAASLLFAFNISKSSIVKDLLNLKQIPQEKLEGVLRETLDVHDSVTGVKDENNGEYTDESPLRLWNA